MEGDLYRQAVREIQNRLRSLEDEIQKLVLELDLGGEEEAATSLIEQLDRCCDIAEAAANQEGHWYTADRALASLGERLVQIREGKVRPERKHFSRPLTFRVTFSHRVLLSNLFGDLRLLIHQFSDVWRTFRQVPNDLAASVLSGFGHASPPKKLVVRKRTRRPRWRKTLNRSCAECGYSLFGLPNFTCRHCGAVSSYLTVQAGTTCSHCHQAVDLEQLEQPYPCPECGLEFVLHPNVSIASFEPALERIPELCRLMSCVPSPKA